MRKEIKWGGIEGGDEGYDWRMERGWRVCKGNV